MEDDEGASEDVVVDVVAETSSTTHTSAVQAYEVSALPTTTHCRAVAKPAPRTSWPLAF